MKSPADVTNILGTPPVAKLFAFVDNVEDRIDESRLAVVQPAFSQLARGPCFRRCMT